MTHSNV